VHVAIAVIRYVQLNAEIPQHHNVTPCQHGDSNMDIVQRCCNAILWLAWPKVDHLSVVLDEAVAVIDSLQKLCLQSSHTHKQKSWNPQPEVLEPFVNHVMLEGQPTRAVGGAVQKAMFKVGSIQYVLLLVNLTLGDTEETHRCLSYSSCELWGQTSTMYAETNTYCNGAVNQSVCKIDKLKLARQI